MGRHILLTGATGLLGRYLLKDLLLAERPVAVLVRPNRRQSAAERVESLMATWERRLQRQLPEPVVLSGNVCQPALGLTAAERQWVEENCDLLLHNAASLSFQAADRRSEPWLSNVQGTQHALDLCAEAEIPDFHHVSTAYVCGLRGGRVRETELDVGQPFGNDYERSKVEAEQRIRAARFLDRPTFYRPAILVGDSSNGFTTTFHGFYAALRIVHTLAQAMETNGQDVAQIPARRITLSGRERKHFVPVDWVSAVIVSIVTSPQHHGRTYHLTPSEPVTTRQIRDTLEAANNFYGTEFVGDVPLDDPSEIERLFYEHLQVYDSYWRNDPEFDRTHLLAAAGHLPCPRVDSALLMRLSKAAIAMEFRFKDEPARRADWVDA